MKKLLALALTLVMLVPMALMPVANAEGEFTTEPFYSLGWSDFDEKTYPYLDGLVSSSFKNIGDKAILAYGGASMMYGSYTDADVTKFAQEMKKTMEARPEGTRYWHVFGPTKILKLAPKNVLFLDHGIVQLQELFTAAVKKMHEIGCPLDGVVIDTELVFMGAWYIYANNTHSVDHYQKNKNIYAQIVADPRYATEVRPLLEERGFYFWPSPGGEKSEIYSICYLNKGEEYDQARNIWNTVMRIRLNQYANKWCYEPLKTYYPEASLSDYQSHDSKSWMKLYGITDDGVALSGGSSIRVGTASSFSYYYARPGQTFFDDMNQYASFNDGYYEASPFNSLLYDINFTRHMYSSTETKQIAPWITSYLYGSEKECSMARTPYYSELLYHLGLFDPEPFLSYTYVNEYKEDDGTISFTSTKYLLTQQIQNEIMAELTRVAGFSDRKPIELPQDWNAEFVLSGMYAGGRNIWRITPNTDEISLEAFKVEGTDPTFSVKGRTVTFPGGKIIESATISTAGSCGYWVETAKDVTPIITNDADRYAKYPSYEANFDDCAEGKMFASLMDPSNAWDYTVADGSAANIVAFGNGKALSAQGDTIFKNTVIPAKITAGDSYAEDQTWELTVNIPEGLAATAEISLLKYAGSGMRTNDGGIKIQGGKVYYGVLGAADANGNATVEYKELASIAAGTYTFKRVMNFNEAKNFTYSLYVLGADGKEIASVKDVATPFFTTIGSVSFGAKGADKAVLFDEYKLYPSGLTTDFELYDAATGINVLDTENSRNRSIAFRLSWLNGTASGTKASVMAAIYENGTLKEKKVIQEVQMNPGYDKVETGIVEVAEGQRVLVYLQKEGEQVEIPTTDPKGPAPTDPTTPTETNPTTPTETNPVQKPAEKQEMDAAKIVLIAVIVLAVVAVVLALVLTKKPAKK